ncbi:helix-turn-helix transcriptional regulator [Methylobacterium sp. NPDC080182]|uniref:helix-turn-helix transcriptional regulator n=1 Tax=Methylobacterium sp. NPDC080182 TaxID=3390590 RepID=UPI003D01A165
MLRIEAVTAKTGISKSGVYAMVARGEFPAPVRVGPRASRWRSGAVDEWIRRRLTEGAAA